MKNIILVFSLLSVTFLFANKRTIVLRGKQAADKIPNTEIIRLKTFTNVPNYVKFKKGKGIPLSKLEGWLNKFYKTNATYGLKLIKKEVGKLGLSHYRYKQTVNGVPVELSSFIAHVDNGMIVSINGEMFSNVNAPSNASLTEAVALNRALNSINAETYKWEIPKEEEHLRMEQEDPEATYYPKGELVLINKRGLVKSEIKLAYKFNIYAKKPLSRREIYVDASSGEILWEESQIHHADAVGTAATAYSGAQNITTDDNGGVFRLRETGRGNGIETYDMKNGDDYSLALDFTDADNNWNNVNPALDQYATDAHWGAEMTYDYFLNEHGRNSIDGLGFKLLGYVHANLGLATQNNAFWDGQRMTYGDGTRGYTPLTSIDIVGHEITHGLTRKTADLINQNESGALNESFSDIFGVAVDYFARPTIANFTHGEEVFGRPIRSMSNPNEYRHPDTYLGNNWSSTGRNHTNSGVQNYWYYLLVRGGSGINDNGDNYNVSGIGLTDASSIAFRNLTVYLTPSSDYSDARFFAIQSAIDFFGGCSPEVGAVTSAWYAVGVGPEFVPTVLSDFDVTIVSSCKAPFTVNFDNISINGLTYSWDFGDGSSSTLANPSNTYNSFGSYTVELIAKGGAFCGVDTARKLAYIVVDSTLPCINVLPSSGTINTQTSCSGTLYDSGGPNGNYGVSEDAQVTISPVGAVTVDLTFTNFDVEQGQPGLCNYDYIKVYDGPSVGSSLIGTYCNDNVPTIVSSTGPSITVIFHSDVMEQRSGFQIDWQCQKATSLPVTDFTVDTDTTCSGIVKFMDASNNGPTSWNWNFGDGNSSAQKDPTHTYTTNGFYTVELVSTNALGSDTAIKTSYIFVQLPPSPKNVDDTVCENDTASLGATGLGILKWYSMPTGGAVIDTGGTFITPLLSTTTNYYVEDVIVGVNESMGKPNNVGVGENSNNLNYLIFDVYQQMEIVSVVVYAAVAGNRIIELRDYTGVVLQTKVVNIPAGTQTIFLNFDVASGTDYQLGISSNSVIDMYRNNSGVTYPYTLDGIGSVKRSSSNQNNGLDHYYFFYDWKVRSNCISARTAVTANVNPAPLIIANTTADTICSGDPVTLSGSGGVNYLWNNGVADGVSFAPTATATYTVTGTETGGNNCVNSDQVTIVVNICTSIGEFGKAANIHAHINGVNELVLDLTFFDKGSYSLVLLNSLGQVVEREQLNLTESVQREIVQLRSYSKGIYYLNIYNSSQNYTSKIVK